MDKRGNKIGLALSGGGYRAAAYHIGTLRALHKLGILDKVDVISSVSGGSITAAYYTLHKNNGYDKFEKEFINKLNHNVLWIAVIELSLVIGCILAMIIFTPSGYRWVTFIICAFLLLLFWYYVLPASKFIEWAYNLLFFKGAKLDSMPNSPVLAINATDLSTGNQFTFSQDRMTCYPYNNTLQFNTNKFPLSRAVMASSCIPQIFSPIKIGKKYREGDSQIKPLLVDGGLYDNQGAHKFDSSDNHFAVDYAIISDAGNSKIDTSEEAFNEILCLVEKNIGWEELLQRKPKRQEIAAKVGTNLIGLKMKQINALIEHSEWMTEVQVRMHLPFLAK